MPHPAQLLPLVALSLLVVTPLCASDFVRGDVNEDGGVSIADLVRLIGYVVIDGDQPICLDSADVDDDGWIGLTDPIWLISFLFGPTGASALPAPYPDAGTDPTDDALPPCTTPLEGPTGSELPHVFFFFSEADGPSGFVIAPGQGPVRVPLRLESAEAIEGLTISLDYEPSQLDSLTIDFGGGVPHASGADLRVSHVSPNYPGRVYGYVVMQLLPPIDITAFPGGDSVLLGHVWIEPRADLPIGSVVEVRFETLPSSGDEPPIRNEMVLDGAGMVYPTTITLLAPVAPIEEIFIRGDANRDGTVDITDGISLLQYLYFAQGATMSCLDACDVDDNGVLDLADPLRLLFTLFDPAQTASPASPFPYQGIDLTPGDTLGCE